MSIPKLRECLEPETDKYERVIYRKAVRINSRRSQIFTTQDLKDKSRDSLIEVLPNRLPEETAIRLSTDHLGNDCLEAIMHGQSKKIFSKDMDKIGDQADDSYPVEALYTEINGFGIEAKFNRENLMKGEVKAILEISECIDTDILPTSVF